MQVTHIFILVIHSKVTPFLTKLYEIADEYKDTITWNQHGDAFAIVNLSQFCEKILPKYFKHCNFASFVRQLNMYDFHKSKSNVIDQEYQHVYFQKGGINKLNLIKRKTCAEVSNKDIIPSDNSSKFDLNIFKKETFDIWTSIKNIKQRVEILEGKQEFLQFCHSDLLVRNSKIKAQLLALVDKERNLESILSFAIKNCASSVCLKGSELKCLENLMLENVDRNQLLEKSSFLKNETSYKIFKEIKSLMQYYYLVNSSDEAEPDVKSLVSLCPNQDAKNHKMSFDAQTEMNYYDQMKEFQKQIMNKHEKCNSEMNNFNSNTDLGMYPWKSPSVQIIETTNSPSNEVSDEVDQSISRRVILGSLLNRKKKRENVQVKDAYDSQSHLVSYKLEKARDDDIM